MNKSDYQLSQLHSTELESIANLYRAAFKKEPSLKSFQWKYFDNPMGPAKLIGIFNEDQLVGSGALLPEEMSVFGRPETVYKFTDLMVHPNHQKKGLAKSIIDALVLSITSDGKTSISYTMCSKIATFGFAKNNYVKLSSIYNFFKPLPLIKLTNLFNRIGSLYSKGVLILEDEIPDSLRDFQFSISEDKLEVKKSFDFLQWRIANPKFKYKTICYVEDEQITGYIIVGIGKSNILNIIDFEVLKGNQKVLKTLLKAAEHEVSQNAYRGITGLSIEGSTWSKVLKNNRFIVNRFQKGPLQSSLDFNVLLREDEPRIMNKGNWEINSINYDDI